MSSMVDIKNGICANLVAMFPLGLFGVLVVSVATGWNRRLVVQAEEPSTAEASGPRVSGRRNAVIS